MPVPGEQLEQLSLRPGRFEYKRLAIALAVSLAIHGLLYGGYQFSRTVLPNWLEKVKILAALAEELRPKKPAPPPQPEEPPMVFVDVNPEVATPEPPKNAPYYSTHNSKASNPDATIDSDVPKLDGRQEHVAKTEDSPKKFEPLHPNASPQQEQKPEQAKPKPPVGDLAMAKPDLTPRPPDNGTEEHTRPRTITEAKMRQNNNLMPGEKMKQDGGVKRHLEISLLDAKATPFGEYDRAFIEAVEQHWFSLLDSRQFALDRSGKVVLQFRLNYDGTVTDVSVADTTVGDTLAFVCRLAVTDPSPYEKWPSDMRRMFGDSRNVQFTFYY
jgi:hypothetical protein